MNKTINSGMPSANLAINKSRIKIYNKTEVPTYFLQKGQEFQIELFNPTTDTILAKIALNGTKIGQGGLVLRPGERVFLDRYIDVSRKFKFDTYEVADTSEVKAAIKDNGDFKVEFFKEYIAPATYYPWNQQIFGGTLFSGGDGGGGRTTINGDIKDYTHNINGAVQNNHTEYLDNMTLGMDDNKSAQFSADINTVTTNSLDDNQVLGDSSIGLASLDAVRDFAPQELERRVEINKPIKKFKSKTRSKSIETGRVEQGSHSDQTMETVQMNWLSYPFHTIEYKMLPVSQKVNTVQDIQVGRYCTSCGTKIKKSTFKFCPHCGTKA